MEWTVEASAEAESLSKWKEVVAISLTFTILMILVVALRFWIRRRTLRREDWIIGSCMISSIVYSATCIAQTRYGLGLPAELRPMQDYEQYIRLNYAARPFYLWGIAGFKLAFCITYLRMTAGSIDRRYRKFIVLIAAFSTLAQTAFVFVYLFYCSPVRRMFHPEVSGSCVPYAPVAYSNSVITIICDVIIFLAPIPLIYRLQLERAVKLGLSLIFCLGLLTTLLSILRITQIHRIAFGDGDSTDFVIRSGLELNVGIITSCLPVLRPLLAYVPRKLISLVPGSSTRRTEEQEASASLERSATRTIGGGYVLRQTKSCKQPPPHKRQLSALKVECLPPNTTGESREDFFKKTNDFERSDSLPSALSLPSPLSLDEPKPTYARPESGESEWAVYKTVQIDVESTYLGSPTSERTFRDSGKGVHRHEEWSLPIQRP